MFGRLAVSLMRAAWLRRMAGSVMRASAFSSMMACSWQGLSRRVRMAWRRVRASTWWLISTGSVMPAARVISSM